jgi:FkbM family methyltransferase
LKQFLKKAALLGRRYLHRPRRGNYSEIGLLHARLTRGSNAGRVMVDVGAQFGESLAPFRLFGWRIIAFEPDPDPRKQSALKRHEKGNVKVVRCALADSPSDAVDFYASEVSTGISALTPFHESHRAVARVPVSTLAIELAGRNFNQIDFLKIDTEGHDIFVLKGFPWSEACLRPRAVLCEFEDNKTRLLGYTWRDMADYLVDKGYVVLVSEWYPIVRYGANHQWRGMHRYPTAEVDPAGWGNLIALIDPADATWLIEAAGRHLKI